MQKQLSSSTLITTEQLITLIVEKGKSILDELLLLSRSVVGVPLPIPKQLISSSVERTTKMAKSCLLLIKVIKSYLPSLASEAKLLEGSVIPLVKLVKDLADTAGDDLKTNQNFKVSFRNYQTSIVSSIRSLLAGAEAWKNANRVRSVSVADREEGSFNPLVGSSSSSREVNYNQYDQPVCSLTAANLPDFAKNLTRQISEICGIANAGINLGSANYQNSNNNNLNSAPESVALYNASRNALRSINELVLYSQCHNLTSDLESDLRQASYELVACSKSRLLRDNSYNGSSSSASLDLATKRMVEAIRNFLSAAAGNSPSLTASPQFANSFSPSNSTIILPPRQRGGKSSETISSASSAQKKDLLLTSQATGNTRGTVSAGSSSSPGWKAPNSSKLQHGPPKISINENNSNNSSPPQPHKNTSPNSDSGYEQRMRDASIKEFKESETKYYTQLKQLVMYFIEPVKKETGTNFVNFCKEPSISVILSTTITITSLTKQIVSDISKSGEVEIGAIFKNMAPVFKMYQDYINFYERAIGFIKESKSKDKELDAFCKKFCGEVGTQDVSFFLILPVQRLPRYEMLISGVAKFTPAKHIDHQNLNEALIAIRDINQVINLRAAEDKNRQKIMEISSLLSIPAPFESDFLFSKPRLYTREGMLLSSSIAQSANSSDDSSASQKSETFFYFLFSDILIKCKVLGKKECKKVGKKYELVEILDLGSVRIEEKEAGGGNNFIVVFEENSSQPTTPTTTTYCNNNKKLELGCLVEEEKKEWVQDLKDAVSVNKLKKQTELLDRI